MGGGAGKIEPGGSTVKKGLLPSVPLMGILVVLFLAPVFSHQYQVMPPYVMFPFPLQQVELLEGSPFKIGERRCINWLKKDLQVTTFLYAFRRKYGLSLQGMRPAGGWEEPDGQLCGFMTGHVLSALAYGVAATSDETIKTKMVQLVRGLDTCQSRAVEKGMAEGCLSAYGEGQFTALENNGTYPNDCWAPWYTQHKILAGLIHCYRYAGDTIALRIAKAMGTWAYNRLKNIPSSTLQSMWSRYIAGEYGGYNEAAADLYMITGDTTYRRLAILFDDNTNTGASLTNLVANKDQLKGTHANMYLPRLSGYLKIFDASENEDYYTASYNFWDMVAYHHSFSIGGHNANTSNAEAFMGRDEIAATISLDRTNEHCASFHMAKLSNLMLYHTADIHYADYWEREAMNHLLSNANIPAGTSPSTPFASYMTEIKCGINKHEWQNGTSFTCCSGTGIETHLRYNEGIFAHNGDTLFINYYIPSQLTWPEKNLVVKMEGSYPESDTLKITVTPAETTRMYIKIRVAGWIRRPIGIAINDTVRHQGPLAPGTWFVLRRNVWKSTQPEVVTLIVPQTLSWESTPDDANIGSVLFGNNVLAAITGSTSYQNLDASTLSRSGGSGLEFKATSPALTYVPFYMTGNERYSIYTKITNIPSSWNDTILDEQDDPIDASDTAFTGTGILSSTIFSYDNLASVKIQPGKTFITVTLPAIFSIDRRVRCRIFNTAGALVCDDVQQLPLGVNSLVFNKKRVFPAGIYLSIITLGAHRFIVPCCIAQ